MKPTQKQKEDAVAYIANLDDALTDKCSLCNTTLVHTIMKGHASTGAPISTIIGELVEKYNEGKPAGDQVSAEALKGRVKRQTSTPELNGSKRPDKPSAPKKTSSPNPASVSSTCVTNNDDSPEETGTATAPADTGNTNDAPEPQEAAPDIPVMGQESQESQESKPHQNPFINTSSNNPAEDTQDAPVSNSSTAPGQTTHQQENTSEASPGHPEPTEKDTESKPYTKVKTPLDVLTEKRKNIINFLNGLEDGPVKDECEEAFATHALLHVNKEMATRIPVISQAARCMMNGISNPSVSCPCPDKVASE